MAWRKIKRRHYLVMKAIEQGAGLLPAIEAVASTAIEHPEWDMDELKTWPEWDQVHTVRLEPKEEEA
jgi:hypothetical protein